MENRPKTTFKIEISRNPSNPKFKPIKFDHNQLQFKYDVYKNGSPNVYQQNLDNLKAYPIKNSIKTLQMAGIQHILKEMKKISPNTGANHRDFNLHPSTIQKYSKKFRTLISDSQETKDFIEWFAHKQKQIRQRDCSSQQKFYHSQNLIATGFNQMIIHLAHVSKSRSQILKLLWNKQNKEVQSIFSQMNLQNIQFQRKNLERVKDLHLGYQQQIINLRNENYCLEKKLQQAVLLNEGCINSIRVMRKQVKKYERMIKKLNQANYSLKSEYLQVFQENVQLMMKDKNISHQKASILSCEIRQLKKVRKILNKNRGTKEVFKQIKNKAEHIVDTKSYNFQENKDRLIEGIKKRMKQNCHSKIYFSKSQLDEDEEQEIHLQSIIDNVINCKELRPSLQITKDFSKGFFVNQATNTEFSLVQFQTEQKNENQNAKEKKVEKRYENVGIQVNTTRLQNGNYKSLLNFEPNEEQQGKEKLKKMKMQQRHSLILIEMNKMMEFKKMEVGNRAKRISNTSNSIRKSIFGPNSSNPRNSNFSSNNKLSEVQSEVDSNSEIDQKKEIAETIKNDKEAFPQEENKMREQNFIRKHHESLIIQKGEELKNLIAVITKEPVQEMKQKAHQIKYNKPHSLKQHHKSDQIEEKLLDIKALVRKYIQSKSIQKQSISNPEKHLRKILTDTFKNLFVSRKFNFLEELVRTAKNSFGKLIYQNKLVHLISIIIQCRQRTLLSALTILLGIEPLDKIYASINFSDVSEVYLKLYFYLTLKNPMQNQFNLWNNYTNLAKLNSSGFVDILKNYFSQSKYLYLNLKIRQFIGITDNAQVDNNYYVQLNTLMTYILQVYMTQKQNYYESYHQMIEFLSDQEYIKLETLIFLMDLLCVKQFQQKEIVKNYFTYGNDQNGYNKHCHKDIFYRICVKYELPLFQFIKVMKLNQFKQIQSCLQSELNQICEYDKWIKVKENLENLLRSSHKFVDGLSLILSRLDHYMKTKCNFGYFSEPFLFFYRIIIYNAFT